MRVVRPSIVGGTSLRHICPGYIGNAAGAHPPGPALLLPSARVLAVHAVLAALRWPPPRGSHPLPRHHRPQALHFSKVVLKII